MCVCLLNDVNTKHSVACPLSLTQRYTKIPSHSVILCLSGSLSVVKNSTHNQSVRLTRTLSVFVASLANSPACMPVCQSVCARERKGKKARPQESGERETESKRE